MCEGKSPKIQGKTLLAFLTCARILYIMYLPILPLFETK